jgi:hypothetical protein
MDSTRWLRYILPGSISEFWIVLWILFDHQFSSSYRCLVDLSGTEIAALLAGAAVPIGFLCSMAAQQALWLTWSHPWFFERTRSPRLMEVFGRDALELEALEHGGPNPGIEMEEARLDLLFHTILNPRIADRARQLRDLGNALLNTTFATMVGLITVAIAIVATSLRQWDEGFSFERLLVAAMVMLLGIFSIVGLCFSQRRVGRITNYYVELALREAR